MVQMTMLEILRDLFEQQNKEQYGVAFHTKKHVPKLIIAKMVGHVMLWFNSFPMKGSISDTLSPRVIMTGTKMNYKKHCRLPFGAYTQVHEEEKPTTSAKVEHTLGAICLGPENNL